MRSVLRNALQTGRRIAGLTSDPGEHYKLTDRSVGRQRPRAHAARSRTNPESSIVKAQRKSPVNDERLAEIYRTAAQVILQKGYDATSVNDIAAALGITKAGLYHYIRGKKELLYDIMNFGLDELDAEVINPALEIADPEERLRFLIATDARLVTRGQGAITILVEEMSALTTQQNRKITKRKRAFFDVVRNTLVELEAAGKLQDVNTTAAAFCILGMIQWLSRWFRQDGAMTEEEAAAELTKIALGGVLRAAPARSRAPVSAGRSATS
jgi:TetR/AcrR family transcriptional regulator, cholesterol catabolism regulator